MKFKGQIYLIVIIIALLAIFAQNVINLFSGCTSIAKKFENMDLAIAYEKDFSMQLASDGYSVENQVWSVEKQDQGCILQFDVYVFNTKTFRRGWIHGDRFFVNKQERKVYPLSDGAQLFIDANDFDTVMH